MSRKFILVTDNFSGLGFCFDERNKNDDIIIARNPNMDKFKDDEEFEKYNLIGQGMKGDKKWVFDLADVMKHRQKFKEWYWIWDGNHSVEENELLRKEGFNVGLGGELAFKMENDRMFGIQTAEDAGIESPLWEKFQTAEEGVKFLNDYPEWAFACKSDAGEAYETFVPPPHGDPRNWNKYLQLWLESKDLKDYVLQKMEHGTEINLSYYCVEGKPLAVDINLEVKRMSSEDKGCLFGCSFDVTKEMSFDSKLVKETIAKFDKFVKDNNWTGFFDVNFILGDTEVWFIEFCGRVGYNAHPNVFANLADKDFLNTVADMVDGTYKPKFKKGWGASICVYTDHPDKGTPMVVSADIKNRIYWYDAFQDGEVIKQTGWANELGIVFGYESTIKTALADALRNTDKFAEGVINLDYRADCTRDDYYSSPIKRINALLQGEYL